MRFYSQTQMLSPLGLSEIALSLLSNMIKFALGTLSYRSLRNFLHSAICQKTTLLRDTLVRLRNRTNTMSKSIFQRFVIELASGWTLAICILLRLQYSRMQRSLFSWHGPSTLDLRIHESGVDESVSENPTQITPRIFLSMERCEYAPYLHTISSS